MTLSVATPYVVLVLMVAVERVVELIVSKRHERWSLRLGGVETGASHYPWMVALHTGLLVGCLLEVGVFDRPFIPWLGWTMVVVVIAAQALRWWCIATLGRQWCTRVIVVPGMRRVDRGPYRWFTHPNYVAVAAEGIALPLVHTGWITALTFTVLNAWVIRVRLVDENAALRALTGSSVPHE
jgi:methyltransferase